MFLCDWENFDLMVKKIDNDLKKGLKVIDPFSYLGLVDDPFSAKLASEIFVKNRFPETLKIQPLSQHFNKKPMGNGVITCLNLKQAEARTKKGKEAAKAIKMVLDNEIS